MIFSAAAAIIALALTAAGAQADNGAAPGSCSQTVQTSSGGSGQSNSSTVIQTSQGGDGGSASCESTVQSTNQVSGGDAGGATTTELRGKGAQTLRRPLTEKLAARLTRRIAGGIDAGARQAAPNCRERRTGRVRCVVDWTAERGPAHVRIVFRATDDGIRWAYRGSIS